MGALKWITCGSVDDGKSTLIGRLLLDSQSVLQDQLASVQRAGHTDLALLTDGLSAEREQGITIDVAWRYFASPTRKFIMGDAPGHEQYTRNMVTAASQADAAVVLVDATKIDVRQPQLLPQTRRHSLLAYWLGVPSLVFAINKLDAVEDGALAFANIAASLRAFAQPAGFEIAALVPISALHGHNVVRPVPLWSGYSGPSLLQVLEQLPLAQAKTEGGFAMPVQWVEKFSASADTSRGRRLFWGRLAQGTARVGDAVSVFPGARRARIAGTRSCAPAGRGGRRLQRWADARSRNRCFAG
jgi:sulfate adenylyltransferase subunit 1